MSPLQSNDLRPLGDQIELFLGQTASEHGYDSTRASYNRDRWLELFRDPNKLSNFLSSLSLCQLSSHELLREWLNERLEDSEFELEARAAQSLFESERNAKGSGTPPSYHYQLARLLSFEFSYPAEGTPVDLFLAELQQFRRDAALYASCQRVARRCCLAAISERDPNRTERPRRPPYGASIEPCSWLGRRDLANDLPYYLWDVKYKRTRIVKDIIAASARSPEYVAISHTWGRWIKEDAPWISLPNVPWKIPQNEKFDVSELPQLLERFPCEYIWLDLLTIPQEDSPEDMVKIQQGEIARQAAIFRNASSAVAWLKDIQNWSALPSTIRYLSFNFLRNFSINEANRAALSFLLSDASTAADNFIELLDPHKDEKRDPNQRKPNPWFTSLWTLQEVCLRPDMWLCNSNWEFLAVSDDTPLALNDIVALSLVNSTIPSLAAQAPIGVRELTRLFRITGLQNLLQLSQLSIITMGNERHCTSRRAEAIMSAIGVTDWFRDFNDQSDNNLVLDLYPLPFVNEVRVKVGSATFFSSTPLGWEFHYVLYKFCSDKRTKGWKFEELGSLLPFGPGAHTVAWEVESNPHMLEHPALKTWTIENSGCVHIKKAGVISSSLTNGARGGQLRCILAAPSAEGDENKLTVQQDADLHEWIRSYKPYSPNFAVCLLHSSLASRGILLKQMEPGILLKVGNYWQYEPPGYEMPEIQEVDWLVM
jgi:Heterokaryon incompatibility protein (HET)